jgi:hypothetical protein
MTQQSFSEAGWKIGDLFLFFLLLVSMADEILGLGQD